MLECYLDDSGTHDGSRILVWGAIAGDKKFFEELDHAWKAQLANPCNGKPPIKSFHSSHLNSSHGEFAGYNRAERDRTRWNFRNIIVNCGLTFFAYGVSMDAWEKVTAEHEMLGEIFSAESFLFSGIFKHICESAKAHGEPISFQIDKARFSADLADNINVAMDRAGVDNEFVSYGFWPVKEVSGLQAADLVANEIYQFYLGRLDNPSSEPDIHLQKLVEEIHDFRDGWFGEEELRSMAIKTEGKINWNNRSD